MSITTPNAIPQGGATAPATDAYAITPNDGADLPSIARGIYVGGSGDLALTTASGSLVNFVGVPAGAILPLWTCKVASTGTTATGLIALI